MRSRFGAGLAILWAALVRDARIARSYRLAFVLRFFSTFFQLIVFFFISRLVGFGGHPALAAYGGSYFAFVLIGLAFLQISSLSLTGYAGAINEAQQTGTLEAQAVLPVALPWWVVGGNLWPYLYALGEITLYLLLGVLLGAPLAGANLIGGLIVALAASAALSGLGLMGAALILIFKRGNAIAWGVEAAAALLAGTYFPPELLPAPLPQLALLLPHTHALAALRAAMLQDAPLRDLWPSLMILVGFAAVLLPAGILALNWAYRQAQARGNLAQY